jgi:hypothetical protein
VSTTKKCSKCGIIKPALEFSLRPNRPVGLYSCCKECKARSRRAQHQVLRWKRPIQTWINSAFHWAKDRARKKDLNFTITKIDIELTLQKTTFKCAYCSCELQFANSQSERATSPSIDRIIQEYGYVPGNIAIACFRCNALKSDSTSTELFNLASRLQVLEQLARASVA